MFGEHERWLVLLAVTVAAIAACIPLRLAIRGWRTGDRSLRHWIPAVALSLFAGLFSLQLRNLPPNTLHSVYLGGSKREAVHVFQLYLQCKADSPSPKNVAYKAVKVQVVPLLCLGALGKFKWESVK